MSSKPLDRLQQTSCKNCKFAIYEENTQTGCEDGRIEKYIEQDRAFEAYDNEKEFYVANTLCSYYVNKEADITLDQMKKQAKKTFGIGVYVEDEDSEEDFLKTVQSIADIDYDHTYIRICINHSYKNMEHLKPLVSAGMRILEKSGFFSVKTVVFGVESLRDFECFKIIGTGHYVTKLCSGDVIPSDAFSNIDNSVNKELKRSIAFRSGSVLTLLMKAVNFRYLEHNDYNKMQESLEQEAIESDFYVEFK